MNFDTPANDQISSIEFCFMAVILLVLTICSIDRFLRVVGPSSEFYSQFIFESLVEYSDAGVF